MRRAASGAARVAALVGVCAVGAPMVVATASAAADPRAVASPTGSVAAVAGDNPRAGAVLAPRSRTIEVWMAGRQRAAQRFVDAVSPPGSSSYHRFLSPSAYTERFGPAAAQVKAVESYLTGVGFTGVRASVNDDYVSATAPVSTIDQAFSVQMRRYLVNGAEGGSSTVESNDRDLPVPASISGDILAVTGLNSSRSQFDDATTDADARAKAQNCSKYWGQKTKTFSPAFEGVTEAAVPVCGYSAKQLRAVYGLSSADTGKGKTIALIQVGAPDEMFQTLTDYAKRNGLPAPRSDQYREEAIGHGGQSRGCINGAVDEAALDSEAAYAMAPGADQLMVDGDSCLNGRTGFTQSLLDAELAPLNGNGSSASAAVESVSYGLTGGHTGERSVSPSDRKASRAVSLRAAAEGVSLLESSGDQPGVEPPSDPDRTLVGGTTLGIGAHGQRLFETGWSTAFGERTGTSGPWQNDGALEGAGGGVSVLYGEPSYQKGVVPSALSRSSDGHVGRGIPDLSADADPQSGMLAGAITVDSRGKTFPYAPSVGGGTSLSTPLVAGMVVDAEQGRRKNLGFLNPLLYSLAGSPAFRDVLPLSPSAPQVDRAFYRPGETEIDHRFAGGFLVGVNDAQVASGTDQVTAPGYDSMTGLGTPNGSAFIKGLRSGKKHPQPGARRAGLRDALTTFSARRASLGQKQDRHGRSRKPRG
jgi:subtilase family serine protease